MTSTARTHWRAPRMAVAYVGLGLWSLGINVAEAAEPPDDIQLSQQTVTSKVVVRACQSVVVGPDVTVEPTGDLSVSAPTISFTSQVSVWGALEAGGHSCWGELEFEQALSEAGSTEVCVPREEFVYPLVGTVVVCGSSTCSNGSTGCRVTLTSSADVDLMTSSLTAHTEGDAAVIDLYIPPPLNETCTVLAHNGTVDLSATYDTILVCNDQFLQIESVTSDAPVATVDLTVQSCSLSFIVNFLADVFEPLLLQEIEQVASQAVDDTAVGAWICPP